MYVKTLAVKVATPIPQKFFSLCMLQASIHATGNIEFTSLNIKCFIMFIMFLTEERLNITCKSLHSVLVMF